MKVRVKITPNRMERLILGKPLVYNVPPGTTELEVVMAEGDDIFSKFDAIFTKTWKKVMEKVEKTASSILK
jgi:hypothetical protein